MKVNPGPPCLKIMELDFAHLQLGGILNYPCFGQHRSDEKPSWLAGPRFTFRMDPIFYKGTWRKAFKNFKLFKSYLELCFSTDLYIHKGRVRGSDTL